MLSRKDIAARSRRAVNQARTSISEIAATQSAMSFTNAERNPQYAFELPTRRNVPGISAMLRAKNEAANVPIVVPEILDLFDEVVFIDNGSTDDTMAQVAAIAAHHPSGDRIRLVSYPFPVSRCGDEHWATPEDSVANLAYFYNWCLSQCSFNYVFKWDLDMVPIPSKKHQLAAAFASVDQQAAQLWSVRCQTIYRTPQGRWLAANGEVNREPRLHPNRATVRYRKARMWEALQPDIELDEHDIGADACIYEMKDTSVDEFDHWTSTDELSPRKQVEYANFIAVQTGQASAEAFTELQPSDVPGAVA